MSRAQKQIPPRIAREAAAWVVREHAGFSPKEAARFHAWVTDPMHRQAWQAARGIWSDMDDAGVLVKQGFLTRHAQKPGPWILRWRRIRRPLTWGVAMAAGVTLVVMGPTWLIAARADARTGTGEVRTVRLQDGSTVTLDTQSAVAVDFGSSRRLIRLLDGTAEFEVAPDSKRPFVVEAGGTATTALGTVFTVQHEPNGVEVTALEHSITVRATTSENAPVILQPGQSVHYDSRSGLGPVAQASVGADAWRRGLLMFTHQPLGEVLQILNRYYSGRILVLDPALARLPVSGVFPTNDPLAAITTLERTLAIHTRRPIPGLVLVYR